MSKRRTDPVEAIIANALVASNIKFTSDTDDRAKNLDFYLPDLDIHIECKRLYTDRINEQMSRVENLIVIQGIKAAKVFADIIVGQGK